MKEVGNILRILREAKDFVEEDRFNELKALSNQTIHSAAISQDGDNLIVAVLIYSLGKVMERPHYREMEGWDEFYGALIGHLDGAIVALIENDVDEARFHLGAIRNSLNEIEGDLGFWIKDVFRKAEINKAFKLYEHGLSVEATAELLGVSLWDMASYIGQSHVGDSKFGICMSEVERVKMLEAFFEEDGK